MSLPTSRALRPAAIAAALPPLDPPGVRPRSHGLLARPWIGLADCQSASMGGTLVLPSRTAPAARVRCDGGGVVLGHEVAPLRHAAGGGQAGHVERLLDRHGKAEEGAILASRAGLVGVAGLLAGPLEVADHHRVEPAVVALDPADVELGELGAT